MSPAIMKGLIAACLLQCTAAMETLRVGGLIQTTGVGSYGKEAFELWADWVNANTMTTGFMVNLTIEPYFSSILKARIQAMTDSTNTDYQDVIICPYGSGAVISCVGEVDPLYKGPIIVWGGASDTIFSSACASGNKNCFGTFTKASEYFKLTLDYYKGIDHSAKYDSSQPFTNVAVITNHNPFSQSVVAGAKMEIAKSYQYYLQSDTHLSTSKASLNAADKAMVRKAMMMKPDYVLIAGHNGDVESTILTIALDGVNYPKIIMATNSLTSSAVSNFATNSVYMGGVVMPSQWNSDDDTTADSLTKWTSSDFMSNMTTGHATYHAASAAAAGIALAHAYMATSGSATMRAEDLKNKLMQLDFDCFYGRIKFNSDGSIHKPMVAQDRYNNALRTRIWQSPVSTRQTPGSGLVTLSVPQAGTAHAASPQHSITAAWPTMIKVAGMLTGGHSKNAVAKMVLDNAFNSWLTGNAAYPYTISWDFSTPYTGANSATAAWMTARTDPESEHINDIIVCPYTSVASKVCVDHVHANFSGAILIWGGADDAIFSSHCIGKNCLGSLTKASKYMDPALTRVDAQSSSSLTVASFHYNSPFSKAVALGANTTVHASSGLTIQSYTELAATTAGALSSPDQHLIRAAMDHNPDVVAIAGHPGITEHIIQTIGMHSNTPKAIVATNSLNPANYANAQYMQCIIQPDQWKHANTTDLIVQWTAAAFSGISIWNSTPPTYHAASAGSFGIAIANALAGVPTSTPTSWSDPYNFDNYNTRRMDLYMRMKRLDINSFYGKIQFNSDGSTAKPMYAVQRHGANNVLVAPASDSSAVAPSYPLMQSACGLGWYTTTTTTTTMSTTTTKTTMKNMTTATTTTMSTTTTKTTMKNITTKNATTKTTTITTMITNANASTAAPQGAMQTNNAKHACICSGLVAAMVSMTMVATRILH